jgi:hypothetical protein
MSLALKVNLYTGEVSVPRLLPWTNVEIGDVDVFSPALPSLVVYTWYVDETPESTVTHFWRDDESGLVQHELVFVAPVTFEEAVARAHEEAPKRNIDKIHVKHSRVSNKPPGGAKIKHAAEEKAKKSRGRVSAKGRAAKSGPGRRKKHV